MAGGIDWFRWHHGSVTDPKFQLIAKKAGVRLGDVLVVWAFILENASANSDRGTIGQLDFETLDFLLGMEDGTATRILDAMTQRGLIDGSRIARWEARQPKRERDPGPPTDDRPPAKTSTERSREHRAKKNQATPEEAMQRRATPGNASNGQETPREEERREEATPEGVADGASADAPGKPEAKNPRGSRLPEGWTLPKAWGDWTAREFPSWPDDYIRLEGHKFADFWHAKTGKDATKLDWEATWRNWCRGAKGPAKSAAPSSVARQPNHGGRRVVEPA